MVKKTIREISQLLTDYTANKDWLVKHGTSLLGYCRAALSESGDTMSAELETELESMQSHFGEPFDGNLFWG